MIGALKTLTLTAAAVVFVFGSFTGLRLLTSNAKTVDTAPTCQNRTFGKGDKLTSNRVKVNVFNASSRSGLANRALINLQNNGFLGGTIGNSTSATKPGRVAILTNDRSDPRVRLVAKQFIDKVTYAKPDITVDGGVIVLTGRKFQGLRKNARTSIKLDRKVTVCEPVVQLP